MKLSVTGPSYATIMAYVRRPLLFTQPKLIQLEFDAIPMDQNGMLLETDMMVATAPPAGLLLPNGTPATSMLCNMSLQNLYTAGGVLQNVHTSGSWVTIPGATPGAYDCSPHHYCIQGQWDTPNKTYGLTKVSVDGTTSPVNQPSPAVASTWAVNGVNIQFQLTVGQLPQGVTSGTTTYVFDHVNITQVLQ